MANPAVPNTASLYGELSKYGPRAVNSAYAILHGNAPSSDQYDASGWTRYSAMPPLPTVPKSQMKDAGTAQWSGGYDYLHQSGLNDPRREVWSFTGQNRYNRNQDRVYINPTRMQGYESLGTPVLRSHEQYHASQYQDPLWKAIAGHDSGPKRRLASEFAPSMLNFLLPSHGLAGVFGEQALATPQDPDQYVRQNRTAPPNTLVTPSKMTLPYAKLQAIAAQKGVFGPTELSRKYGYQGNAFQPLETLLNTPEGKQWLQMFMTGNQ